MTGTLLELFLARAARHGDREALRALAVAGATAELRYSWADWERASRRVAGALVAGGHRPGERVAILAGNRPLWPIADLGILMAGMVSVGIYPTSAPVQVRQALADCGAVAILVDSPEQLAKVAAVRDELPALRTVVAQRGGSGERVTTWDAWLASGAPALVQSEVAAEVRRRTAATGPDDPALLIYTSGSTGDPKGAIISHRYLSASAAAIAERLGLDEGDRSLSFLPFCHAGERVFGLYTRIHAGMSCGLVADHQRLPEAARAYQPTLFGGLPRLYEKAAELLRAEGPDAGLELYFGGRVRLATCGGASFPKDAVRFLSAKGLEVLGAYGLTEHLCVAMHRPGEADLESAGPPLGSTEIRLAKDGELLLRRSELTFSGYFGRPDETRAAFTADGEWLLTGDLGMVDERGRVRITGRKKELIALASGKKVAPLPIEARLAQDPWIAQAMLYGESRPFISALIVPRRATVERWARKRRMAGTWPDLLRHEEARSRVQEAVDRVNAGLSRPEQVRAFALLERELTAEENELTPTLKLRRAGIAERYRDRLEALYPR
jgi:long-chain acyl-CoA synthetase